MSTAALCPAWSIPGYLEVSNDHLTVNGVDTLELVKKFNSPLFVFSESRIRDNISRLQLAAKAVDRPIKFCYASKANSNMGILKVVLDSGIDIEVNSGGELFKALRVGFQPEQNIFNGTSKCDDEIDDAVRAGIYAINVDSIYEMSWWNNQWNGCEHLARKYRRRASRCVSCRKSVRDHISVYKQRC